jgi:fibronectin-binding autotransporter adhesin
MSMIDRERRARGAVALAACAERPWCRVVALSSQARELRCGYSGSVALAAGPIAAAMARQVFFASTSVVALMVLSAGSAEAQNWTGATSDWMVGSNWSGGVVPTNATVTISTTSPNPTVLGFSGTSVATSGGLIVGDTTSGSLTIQNGSTLTSSATIFSTIGTNGGTGVVNVTGAGSRWTYNGVPGNVSVILGNFSGTGTLNVSNGGSVVTAGDLVVGERSGGTGFLSITSGGTVSTGRDAYIGRFADSNEGTATVSGAGSQWTIAARLFVGNGATGRLVSVGNTTVVADSGSPGTLNMSGGGALQTAWLIGGTGATQVNFDRGVLQARADNANFISGFAGTELNIAAGGLTIDSAGFNVGTDATSALTGVGGLTKIGAGTLSLMASNTYAGETLIQAGTLALAGAGSVATSSRVVANSTFGISGVTPISASIQSLAGSSSGVVNLGTKTLVLTNANDTFAGSITGSGGLSISAGTQTLTG